MIKLLDANTKCLHMEEEIVRKSDAANELELKHGQMQELVRRVTSSEQWLISVAPTKFIRM